MEYHPRTSVSFAATEPFCRRWANEAQEQMRKFKLSTWQQDLEQEEEETLFIPEQLQELAAADQHVAQEELLAQAVEEMAPTPAIAFAILTALFLGGIALGAYLSYKWRGN